MCQFTKVFCTCRKKYAFFHFHNNILDQTASQKLFCPACSQTERYEQSEALDDNGWVIWYDLEIARMQLRKAALDLELLTPAFLFDKGYLTWLGVTPTDYEDLPKLKEPLDLLAKKDKVQYVKEFREFTINREQELRNQGWRKAQNR